MASIGQRHLGDLRRRVSDPRFRLAGISLAALTAFPIANGSGKPGHRGNLGTTGSGEDAVSV